MDRILRQMAHPITEDTQQWVGIYSGSDRKHQAATKRMIGNIGVGGVAFGPHIPAQLQIPEIQHFPGNLHLITDLQNRFQPFLLYIDSRSDFGDPDSQDG